MPLSNNQTPKPALPDERPAQLGAAAHRWDWAWIVAILVVVNVAVAWLAPRTLVEVRNLKQAWERAVTPTSPGPGILIVGDSTAGRVVEQILEERLGRPVTKLGTFAGMTATHSAWIVQHYLAKAQTEAMQKSGAGVKAIVVMHTGPSWTWDRKTLDAWRLDIPVETAVLDSYGPPLELDAMQRLDDELRRALPLYGRGTVVKRWVSNPLRAWRKMRSLGGDSTQSRKPSPSLVKKDAESAAAAALASRKFKPSPVNIAGLERLVEVTRAAGIRLLLAPPPVWEGALAMSQYRREYTEHLAWLDTVAAEHKHVALVLRDTPAYPTDAMHDSANHLLEAASADYTKRLADALIEAMPASGAKD